MKIIWIIGAGKFGLRAAKWLLKQDGQYSVTLVDQDKVSLEQARALGCRVEAGDGIEFLKTRLTRENGPDWIVPAVPVHLAWEWCRLRVDGDSLAPYPLPERIEAHLPNCMHGAGHDIYVSHADFLCPPNCNEPDDRCTKTGEPRKPDMFRLLAEVEFPGITPFVIQSVQLGPGVGGYRPKTLFDLLERIEVHRGPCFVATACRCHGVVSGGRMS
jgi:hypothetical protein